MGQYYEVITENKGDITVYNRYVNGEYTMAKLMEHSWWLNPFVSTICKKIYKNPTRIGWVGDYSKKLLEEKYAEKTSFDVYETVFGENAKSVGVEKDELFLDDKYLVNHSLRTYIDCNEYYNKCVFDDLWCIHPLPLLTAVGNTLGGGDYFSGTCLENVGTWFWDEISIEDEIPENYEKEDVFFIEG